MTPKTVHFAKGTRNKLRKYRKSTEKHPRKSKGSKGEGSAITNGGLFSGSKSKQPFPERQMVKMSYVDNYILTCPIGGGCVEQIIQLNSCLKPDFSFTGHKPYGTNQLSPIYNSYKVMSVDVILSYEDPSADGIFVGGQLMGTATNGQSIGVLAERPWNVIKTVSNTGVQVCQIKQKIPIHKAFGITKQMYKDDSSYQAIWAASPSKPCYLRYYAGQIATTGVAASTVNCTFDLVFNVMVFDRVPLARST